jgi:hypothetical protein
MSLIERACRVIAETEHRYLNPDPARQFAIGDYGRVKDGVLLKRGNLEGWFKSKNIVLPGEVRVARDPSKVLEDQTLASKGVRATTVRIDVEFPIPSMNVNAKFGIDLSFSGEDRYYFHVPGMRWVGMKDMGVIGDKLVSLALLDDHDPRFWEDDYCVCTGVYEVPSFYHAFASESAEHVTFTAEGAATIDGLYKVGAKFVPTTKSSSSTTLVRSYRGDGGDVTVFYELHKVHWDISGRKWWNVVNDLNP